MDFIESYKQETKKIIAYLKEDIAAIRTDRATPALVENFLVDAYGVKTPLKRLASITCPEPRSILIQPWDANIIKEVAKAIQEKNLGANPVLQEKFIRLNLPTLTEEQRENYVKILHEKLENARIQIRGLRDKVRDEIREKERNKEITEDDKYRLWEDLDKETDKLNKEIKELGEVKEKEIMTI